MFGKRKKETISWDREKLRPAVRKSICTGEATFGFVRKTDGSFLGIQLVENDEELSSLLSSYKIRKEDVEEIY